ncbi:MAG: CarD family transcriptional regulator [Oscillospiraceae bacterium]|nr:CarD family transcriptional regulator [Oscillospiraceae bacterium]
MFSINEYVIYGSEGVCRVESIGHPDISGLDKLKEYYTLLPVYKSGRIYTPIDSTIHMRRVITKTKAQELIDNIKEISHELDVPKDIKQANLFYRDLVRSYECSKLISLIKYVFFKQREFSLIKRNMPAVDLKFLKIAEDMLYSEFGFALGIDPKDVKGYIIKCCEE